MVKNLPYKQEILVQSLVQEAPTCHWAAKPVYRDCCSLHSLQPVSANREASAMRRPHTTRGESPQAAVKTQRSQK